MQFVVENEAFAKAMSLVKSCVPAKTTIPILCHVVVSASGETLSIRATNLDREIETTIPARIDEAGSAALPGSVLAALAAKLIKGGEAEFKLAKERCKIKSGASKYDLRVLPPEDFPTRKEVGDGSVAFDADAKGLRGLIQATIYAVADRTDNRQFLRGVYLHIGDRKLTAVGTDGLRMAIKSMEMPKGSATMPAIIVPTDTAKQIAELLSGIEGDAQIVVSPRMIELQWNGLRFASQLVDGEYPQYQKFIPKPNGVAASFRPYALSEAISRASIVYLGEVNTDARVPFAGFAIGDGNIELQCGATAAERASEIVEAETNGTKLSFRTNAEHMMQMLATWPESVSVDVQQHKDGAPILFTAKDMPEMTAIVMPSMKG